MIEDKEFKLDKYAVLITVFFILFIVVYNNDKYDLFDLLISGLVLFIVKDQWEEVKKSKISIWISLISVSIAFAIFATSFIRYQEIFDSISSLNDTTLSIMFFIFISIIYLISPKLKNQSGSTMKTNNKESGHKNKIGKDIFQNVELKNEENLVTLIMENEEDYNISEQDQVNAFQKQQEIENFRGWLISETNNIEQFLKLVITNSFFAPTDSLRRKLFNELILNERFCSLWDKKSIIRGILKSDLLNFNSKITEAELKKYRTDLQEFINIRNDFGHNQIKICVPSLEAKMIKIKDGKEKEINLNDYYLDKIKLLQKELMEMTFEINKQIN